MWNLTEETLLELAKHLEDIGPKTWYNITECHDNVVQHSKGLGSLLQEAGVPASSDTIRNALRGAQKLTPVVWMVAMAAYGSWDQLEKALALSGKRMIDIKEGESTRRTLLGMLAEIQVEAGEAASSVLEALADDRITSQECDHIDREISQAVGKLEQLRQMVKQRSDDDTAKQAKKMNEMFSKK